MKIKMSNEEILQSTEVLKTLGQEKGRLGYAIMRNLRKMEEASTEYRKIKNDAFQKYGVKKELGDGKARITVPDENMQAFWDDIKEVAVIQEDVDVMTVPEEVFYSGNLTSNQMVNLLWMVEDSVPDE